MRRDEASSNRAERLAQKVKLVGVHLGRRAVPGCLRSEVVREIDMGGLINGDSAVRLCHGLQSFIHPLALHPSHHYTIL